MGVTAVSRSPSTDGAKQNSFRRFWNCRTTFPRTTRSIVCWHCSSQKRCRSVCWAGCGAFATRRGIRGKSGTSPSTVSRCDGCSIAPRRRTCCLWSARGHRQWHHAVPSGGGREVERDHFGRTLNRCLVRRTGTIRCAMTPLAEATPYATRTQNQLSDLSPKLVRLKISQIPSPRSRCALLTEWGHRDVRRLRSPQRAQRQTDYRRSPAATRLGLPVRRRLGAGSR